MAHIALIAGTFSTFIFIGSNVPMLWKAYQTKDLHSYSKLNIILANFGNLVYWIYVLNLPVGPIYLLHFFYTITSLVMLGLLIRHNSKQTSKQPRFSKLANGGIFRGHGRSSPPSLPNYRQTGRLPVGSPCS